MATAVNVMDIVDSRSVEVTAAVEALKTNMSVSCKLSIPFYMRRRAASHNPKRLPARVRPNEVEKTKSKYKWKKESVKKSVEGKAKRLETHLWHAKRCHMADLWGYRLAMSTTQKGDRAAYRATNCATTIQDTSFYHWFSVSGDDLHSKLAGFLVPNHQVLNRVVASHLYHEHVCLGPVTVLWISETTVFLRVHPAIPSVSNFPDIFEGLSFKSHADRFSQFTLNGVKSLELLVKSIKLSDQTCECVRDVWNKFLDNPFSYDIMRGTLFGCSVEVPPAQYKPFRSVTSCPITQPPHRLTPDPRWEGDLLFKSELLNYTNQESSTTEEETADSLLCCIYKDPITGCVTVILPRGTCTRLWIPLIYNGGRAIGMQDAHSISTDRNVPTFPYDYPDTPAGKLFLEQIGGEVEAKEMRRPPQKRVRYKELGISCPFVSDWSAVSRTDNIFVIRDPILLNKCRTLSGEYDNHFITVSISCVKRGNIRAGSHLYYTSETTSPDPIYTEQDTYPLVGYVTSGKYCLATGRGGGTGLVLASVYKTLGAPCVPLVGKTAPCVLLVRNTTTRQYRHVRVDRITV